MTRTRMDVWTRTDDEGTWPEVLVAYARAVEAMRALDPSTGKPTARVNDRHFIASSSATACGVVTITADSLACTGAMCSISDRCSSDVPGRRSKSIAEVA